MRLILSMMEDGEDRTALETEIADLEKLLTGFLDYAAGQSHAAPETVDLPDLVQGIVARNAQGGRDVRWLSPDTHLPPLLLRRELIVRALDNLIANALRHGRRADVALVRHPGKIVLSVDDDGPGIPQADRDRATEPFVRLDEARNRDSGSGVGLGLAIVAEAMRLHRGKLVLNDSATLGGLRAELHLPLGEGYNR
jgi:two-component system osmolarity sensor histidine kinase EnvZ